MSDSDNQNESGQNGVDHGQVQDAEQQPRYYIELVDQIISDLEAFVSSNLEAMFKEMDDHLFESAQNAKSTAVQNTMFESMNAVRADKAQIQQGFVDALGYYLQPVSDLDALPEKKKSKKPTELGLVEQTEMDEMVTLNGISSKAASKNSEEISDLIKRLKELSKYNDHIFHGEALEPKRMCDAIHESVSKTALNDQTRMTLYRFFEQVLIKDLASLYQGLNNLLIEQGILPEIEFNPQVPHYEQGSFEEELPAEAEDPVASSPPPPLTPTGGRRAFGSGMAGYSGGQSGGQPSAVAPSGGSPAEQSSYPPGMAPGQNMPAQGQGAPMQGGSLPTGPASAGAPGAVGSGATGGAGQRRAFGSGMQSFAPAQAYNPDSESSSGSSSQALGPSGQATSAGMPVGEVRQSIQSFIGGTHADVVEGGGEGYYSNQQVMTALTGLQEETPEELSQTPLVFDANQIKKAILSSIGESDGGAVTKAVHQVSEKTIDFIKLIFDAIIEEDSITDEIKTLLLSLQIPVIKAAMLDSDFFVDDQHPARQLLDKIAEAGVGVSEHHDPVYIEIEQVVRKLLNSYKEDISAFTLALDELNELTEEIYRKARETEAKSQKTVRMAHAKGIVLQEIRKITIGKELPMGIRTLVLKVWPSMMFNHYMSHGKANDEWVELLIILQKVIETVQPLNSVQELEELGLTYEDILKGTVNKLDKCRKNKDIIQQVIRELEETYERLIATTGLPDENDAEALAEHQAALGASAESSLTEMGVSEDGLMLDAAEATADPEPEEDAVDPEVRAKEKIAALPEGIAPGTWFIVYNGEDKPVRRLKLAVILIQDATMVFVDHLGNVVIEKDAQEFTDEIEKGQSGMIMQHSVFDHALHSALESIDR